MLFARLGGAPKSRRPGWVCLALLLTPACAGEPGSEDASASGGASPGSGAASNDGAATGGSSGGAPANAGSGGTAGAPATGGVASGGQAPSGGGAGFAGSGGSGGGSAGTGATGSVEVGITALAETMLTTQGLTVVSYGGYLNGESFQQDGIVTHAGVEYAAFWNSSRHVVLSGRTLPDGAWSSLELDDYTNSADDAHNTISIGLSPADGTLHLAFDHHDDELNYRRSSPGFLEIAPGSWQPSDFGPVTAALDPGTTINQVTYPRFVTHPDGETLLLSVRIGQSGNGTARLFEYDGTSSTWTTLGDFIDGAVVDENPYFHGLHFTPGGARLHATWCARATPDASTNHDLYYVYSDDGGRTFRSGDGTELATTGASPLGATNPAARVWEIPQNRGLINQEEMLVSPDGGVHVLLSHIPDGVPSDANFTSARAKSEFFHYYRDPAGQWSRAALGAGVIENFRGELALSSSKNVYAILPDLRIYGASQGSGYQDWQLLFSDPGRFFSDPLVDHSRVLSEDVASIFYPVKSSGQIMVLDFEIH